MVVLPDGFRFRRGRKSFYSCAEAAINNPLLSDISLQGCQSLLINVSAGKDFKMSELEEVTSVIVNVTGSDANIIMGVIIDPNLEEKVSVTIIATGLQNITHQIRDFINIPQGITKPEKESKPLILNIPLKMKLKISSICKH